MVRLVLKRQSKVRLTEPSVEFSIGTMPNSAVPASTARKISSIRSHASPLTDVPNCFSIAISLKVPLGPKKATVVTFSNARQALIISRKICLRDSGAIGPLLLAIALRITLFSRSGRKTGALPRLLIIPTSRAH